MLGWSVSLVALCGFLTVWLVLRFLWKVYDRGGAEDLRVAAQALRLIRRRRE